jgi:uncharacterized protein YecT (DUF1311 family)
MTIDSIAVKLVMVGILFTMFADVGATPAAEMRYPNVAAFQSDVPKDSAWFMQCQRVQSRVPPAADLIVDPAQRMAKNCSASELYYEALHSEGQSPQIWSSVRQCAYTAHDYGVLAMLYANGRGVAKDLDLATKFACSTESAIAEMEGRVAHLAEMGRKRDSKEFDLCDDITSGYMQGMCAVVEERQNGKLREARLVNVMKGWSVTQKSALSNLRRKVENFAKHRADDETDLSGTARRALQVESEADELDQFVEDIVVFERGELDSQPSDSPKVLDARLNQLYWQLMRATGTKLLNLGTITKAGVKATERSWLAYRDAWLDFASIKYPQLDRQTLRMTLTRRRVDQLATLLGKND